MARVNTSLRADSITSVVEVWGRIFTLRVSVVTTAEDVPPRVVPRIRALRKSRPANSYPEMATSSVVTTKLSVVRPSVPLRAARSGPEHLQSAFDKINIRTRLENTRPARPNVAGSMR